MEAATDIGRIRRRSLQCWTLPRAVGEAEEGGEGVREKEYEREREREGEREK